MSRSINKEFEYLNTLFEADFNNKVIFLKKKIDGTNQDILISNYLYDWVMEKWTQMQNLSEDIPLPKKELNTICLR